MPEAVASDGGKADAMFTGLVRSIGVVRAQMEEPGGRRLVISDPTTAKQVQVGDSVAVDGVCLTVVATEDADLTFQVGPETLARTTLGQRQPGERVNLEPALRMGDSLGGHWVNGHVDAVGTILRSVIEGEWRLLDIGFPPEFADLLVPQGSIAVDGVSLTVVSCSHDCFRVMLIPHTQIATTLGRKEAGEAVNLEFDLLAKYVRHLVQRYLHPCSVKDSTLP